MDDVVKQYTTEHHKQAGEAGDLLLEYLEQLGVEYLFGVPGGAIEPLYNALARCQRRNTIKSIVARHETGAAFMAAGYARNSGRLGVCCATTGPGATNLITGVASAYASHVPLLVITAQTSRQHFAKQAFQDSADTAVNTVGMFQFCTRYNTLISHIDQLERKLIAAVMIAMRESMPVHLSIPLDILRAAMPSVTPKYNLPLLVRQPQMHDDVLVQRLCDQVGKAENIIFVLAGDSGEAVPLILEIAPVIGALLITTPDGKGLINPHHPLYRGTIGFAGHDSAEKLLADPRFDTIVAVGSVVNGFTRGTWDGIERGGERLIHVESGASNLTHTPMSSLHVSGSLESIFASLRSAVCASNAAAKQQRSGATLSVCPQARGAQGSAEPALGFELNNTDHYDNDVTPIKPQWLMHQLAQLFPSTTRFFTDTGNSFAWSVHYLHPARANMGERRNDSGGWFQCIPDFSAMGWSIGASIGAMLARPDGPVVSITGDGSLLMSGQEMTVALQHQLAVVFVVLNDSCMGMVKHGQQLNGAEAIAYQLPTVNFAEMARAMGIIGYRINRPDDLLNLDLAEICNRKGPTVLDVVIDPAEVPPMGARVKMLAGDL